jgi:hypothetical protein
MLGKSILAGAVAAVAMAGAAQGALTISASDVVSGQYTYQLKPGTFATQFTNDTSDRYFMDPDANWGDVFVRRSVANFSGVASFTYHFDFTNAGYTISGIHTQELLNTYTNDGIGGISVKYSTDGTNFVTKYGLNASTTGYNFVDTNWQAPDPTWFAYGPAELQGTKSFYYRVEFSVPEESTATTNMYSFMWGRRGSASTSPSFQATFDLQAVPEPTSLVFAGLIGGGLLARKRRQA